MQFSILYDAFKPIRRIYYRHLNVTDINIRRIYYRGSGLQRHRAPLYARSRTEPGVWGLGFCIAGLKI